eukprot:2544115-Rhodomonas_salina.1
MTKWAVNIRSPLVHSGSLVGGYLLLLVLELLDELDELLLQVCSRAGAAAGGHNADQTGEDEQFNDARAVPEQMDLDPQAGGISGGIPVVQAVE